MARVPSRWKMNISYTHAFGMTDNYFVHIEQPMTMNLPKMITLSMTKSCIAEAILCQENEPVYYPLFMFSCYLFVLTTLVLGLVVKWCLLLDSS